jgi:hypothetical protein
MLNVGVLKRSDDVYDCITLPDVCQELIAQALTLGSTFN